MDGRAAGARGWRKARRSPPAVTKRLFADWLGRVAEALKQSNPGLCHRFEGASGRWAFPAQGAGKATFRRQGTVGGNVLVDTSGGWFWRCFGAGWRVPLVESASWPAVPGQNTVSVKSRPQNRRGGPIRAWPMPWVSRGEDLATTGRYGRLTAGSLTRTRVEMGLPSNGRPADEWQQSYLG